MINLPGHPRALLLWLGIAVLVASSCSSSSTELTADELGEVQVVACTDDPSWYGCLPRSFFVRDDLVYVVAGEFGMFVIDIEEPTNPKLVGEFPTHDYLSDVYVHGDFAYLTSSGFGLPKPLLIVVDISRPSEPRERSTARTWDDPQFLFGTDHNIYVSDMGPMVFDVTESATPDLLDEVHYDQTITYDVAVEGQTAFLSGKTEEASWLRVYDVSSPSAVSELGYLEIGQPFVSLAVTANHLLAVGSEAELHVIDLSDPASPRRVGVQGDLGEVFDVVVQGDTAVIASGEAGFRVLDISDPINPEELLAVDTPDFALKVLIEGTRILVLDVQRELSHLRIYGLSRALH